MKSHDTSPITRAGAAGIGFLLAVCLVFAAQAQEGTADEESKEIIACKAAPFQRSALENARAFLSDEIDRLTANEAACTVDFYETADDTANDDSYYHAYMVPRVWYNRVDGVHIGLDRVGESSRRFRFEVGGGLNTAISGRDRWAWRVAARVRSTGQTAPYARAEYAVGTARRSGQDSYMPAQLNGLVMMLGGDDYFDYYHSEGFNVETGVDFHAIRTRLSGKIIRENHAVLEQNTSWDLFKSAVLRPNPAIMPGRLVTASAMALLGTKPRTEGLADERSLQLGMEASVAGSDYSFRRYWLDARWSGTTFCASCPEPDRFALRLNAGTSTGKLPLQRTFMVDNATSILAGFGALRTRTSLPYEGDQMVAVFWEHSFGTAGMRALGLRWLGFHLAAFGGHARTWMADDLDRALPLRTATGGYYNELGVSVKKAVGSTDLRLDFAKALGSGPIAIALRLDIGD